MDILIIVLAIIAMLHFVYEGIVAPTIRMKLNHDLFELRDDIRQYKISNEDCDEQVFDVVHNGINQFINKLHWVTFSFMIEFSRAHKDADYRKEVSRRKKMVDECQSIEIQRACKRGNEIVEFTLAVNSLFLMLYLTPFILMLEVLASARRKFFVRTHAKVSEVFASPSDRTQEIFAHELHHEMSYARAA